MSELEQAIKDAQARHLERLTGPQTCCVKVGPDNMPCGQRLIFLEADRKLKLPSGWYHWTPDLSHYAVPESLIR